MVDQAGDRSDAEVARHARRVIRFRDGHLLSDQRQDAADARAALAVLDSGQTLPDGLTRSEPEFAA